MPGDDSGRFEPDTSQPAAGDVEHAPPAPPTATARDPRSVLVGQLAAAVAAATNAGDLEGARIAAGALARLLQASSVEHADVVDLTREREQHGGQES